MRRILSIPNEFSYICKCFRCGCKFEFQDEDIYQDGISGIDYVYRINCPSCRQDINAWDKNDWLKKSWDK